MYTALVLLGLAGDIKGKFAAKFIGAAFCLSLHKQTDSTKSPGIVVKNKGFQQQKSLEINPGFLLIKSNLVKFEISLTKKGTH